MSADARERISASNVGIDAQDSSSDPSGATNRQVQRGIVEMIKLDIVNEVIHKTGIPRPQAELAIDAVFNGMKKALSAGDRIELRGFGVLSVRPRKAGIGRNPRTGVEVLLTPGRVVRFRPGKTLKNL